MLLNKAIIKKARNKKPTNKKQIKQNNENYEINSVSIIDNHIYFYSSVNTESILELNKHILNLNKSLKKAKFEINERFEANIDSKIYLHINSYGGYIFDALAAIDTIKNSSIPVVSIIEGCAASAASLISVVANKRIMTPNSSILIHQLSGGFWGTYEQMEDDHKNNSYLQNKMKKIYLTHTKGKLKEKRLNKILKRDIWWDPKKCKKLGLIDEII